MKLPTMTGRRSEDADTVEDADLLAARVEVARKNWTEISPPQRLVRRPLGLLIDEETDQVFRLYRGEVFVPGNSNLVSGDGSTSLFFYVAAKGRPVLLERVGNETWSAIVERRARTAARRSTA